MRPAWPSVASDDVASASTLPNDDDDGADETGFVAPAAPDEITEAATGVTFIGNAAGALTGAVKGNRVAKFERIETERA